MTKEAWIFLIAMAVLIWLFGQLGSAAGRKKRLERETERVPKAGQIKNIFQYISAVNDLINKLNELQDQFSNKVPEIYREATFYRDPLATDQINEIEKNFNKCLDEAFKIKEEIDHVINRSEMDMELYTMFENEITYMDIYIEELDHIKPEPYSTEERDIYERGKVSEEYAKKMYKQQQEQKEREEREKQQRYQEQQQYWEQQQQQSQSQANTQDNVDSYFEGCTSKEEIEKRYKALAKVFHPDSQTGDNTAFKNLQEAYENAKKKF